MTQDLIASINRVKLVRFIASFVGDDAAEDVAQDVYVKLLSANPSAEDSAFRGESAFETWVFTVAKHTAIDSLRSASSRPGKWKFPEENNTSGSRTNEAAGSCDYFPPECRTEPVSDDQIDLRRAIAKLPAPLRAAIEASFYYPDRHSAAEALGLGVQGYASRLAKGRALLKTALTGE